MKWRMGYKIVIYDIIFYIMKKLLFLIIYIKGIYIYVFDKLKKIKYIKKR